MSSNSAAKITKLAGACLAVLLVLLLTTQPAQLPAPMLIVPFMLLFLFLTPVLYGACRARGVSKGRGVGVSLLLAGMLVVLLALQSVGQLSWRDAVIIVVLFGVTYIYVTRMINSAHP
jgi:hypothetical protein